MIRRPNTALERNGVCSVRSALVSFLIVRFALMVLFPRRGSAFGR